MTDKFVSPERPPEGLDRELLTILAEECCEVGQRVSKALRFGLMEIQPGQPLSNAERIAEELGDLLATAEELNDVIDWRIVDKAKALKREKLARYLQSN
jgi:NTP pyrophosphatase (non-canonical NTP hydrolase)